LIRRLIRFTGAGFLLSLLIVGCLLVLTPFYVYEVFNQEFPIARLEFTPMGDYEYMGRLSRGDFCTQEEYRILGDQFQVDAGFVKWKGPAVLLGFKPRYRLDRLTGRYRDTRLQNTRQGMAHDLAPDMLFDFFSENTRESSDGWLIDTSYGSSVYYAIDPSLRYTVYATEDGLILRSVGIQDIRRENGNLVIEINQGCGDAGTDARGLLLELNEILGASG
jgi:hypothetical protein